MRASQPFFVLIALFLSLCTFVSSSPAPSERDQESFQRLLKDVSPDCIHSVLHEWSTRFQDGIFSKDITAIEVVHSENAHLATKLVNLAKRQGGASTNTTTTTAGSTTPSVSMTPSTTPSSTPSSEPSSPPHSSSTGSQAHSSPTGIIVPSTTPPGVSTSSTVVAASTPSGASAVSTSNGVVIFSSSGGMTSVPTSNRPVTYRPYSSTVLSTTTLPDGQQSTMTSFTVVNAPDTGLAAAPTGTAGAGEGSGSGTGSPSLQTGAASATRGVLREVVLVMGGAVAVAMALQ